MSSHNRPPDTRPSMALESYIASDYYKLEQAVDGRLNRQTSLAADLSPPEASLRDAISDELGARNDPDADQVVTRGVAMAKLIREVALPGAEGNSVIFNASGGEPDRYLAAINRAHTAMVHHESFTDDNPATASLIETQREAHGNKLDESRVYEELGVKAVRLALISADFQTMERQLMTTRDAGAELTIPSEWSGVPDAEAVELESITMAATDEEWSRFMEGLDGDEAAA